MSTETLVLIILLIVVVGALPTWPYSQSWGYGPSGILIVLAIVLGFWLFSHPHGTSTSSDRLSSDLRHTGDDIRHEARRLGDQTRDAVDDLKR